MSFNAIRENKILAKISESTVYCSIQRMWGLEFKVFIPNGPRRSVKSIILNNKKVKEISENHATKEHQSKQLFNFYVFV